MKRYFGIVHKDPESAWGIFFPDAPGCFSASDELEGLFHNAKEALELWTEGMLAEGHPIAATRTLQEILLDPESKDWLENFTMIIAVPNPFVGDIAA